jgi:hypothetical protein
MDEKCKSLGVGRSKDIFNTAVMRATFHVFPRKHIETRQCYFEIIRMNDDERGFGGEAHVSIVADST